MEWNLASDSGNRNLWHFHEKQSNAAVKTRITIILVELFTIEENLESDFSTRTTDTSLKNKKNSCKNMHNSNLGESVFNKGSLASDLGNITGYTSPEEQRMQL